MSSRNNEEEQDEQQMNEEQALNVMDNIQGQIETEEVKKKKKANVYRFKADMITDVEKGIINLYDEIQKVKFGQNQENFNEIKELDKYIKLIEEWHYSTVPKYDFQYFTERCQKFGGEGSVKSQIQQMRKAHRGIIPWDFLKKNDYDEVQGPPQQASTELPYNNQNNNELPDQQVYENVMDQFNMIEQQHTTHKTQSKLVFRRKIQTDKKITPTEIKNLEQIGFENQDLFGLIEEFETQKANHRK